MKVKWKSTATLKAVVVSRLYCRAGKREVVHKMLKAVSSAESD